MKPKVNYRRYKKSDYQACEALVRKAWGFEQHFTPRHVANSMAFFYTSGAPVACNFNLVAEVEGQVIGFIFGTNNKKLRQTIPFSYQLKSILTLVKYWLHPAASWRQKQSIMAELSTHSRNRSKLRADWESELSLFVIDSEYQGLGIGSYMANAFIDDCKKYGVKEVTVEANKAGASSYYEKLGFNYSGQFYSPLHERCSNCGDACLYIYPL
ncbi:GNAT family N-acetyltransferase [Vibrio sp. S9_S30]|uniref:GNAT family N-acetyltransferase n=1 Tax=Vibrio sp. S9_S30 TaxID=2720226 RepID=UPI0016813AD2|nr:GNAT family N-acetyltransferase [Vibrio sp. S9_S30]MBD1560040.1 GNAT family N-acetyltransferase [Vibrio sp. S9_S30]